MKASSRKRSLPIPGKPDCARYLKGLADPERLKIIQCLQQGTRTVGDIALEVNSAMPNVSHHLKKLRGAGIVVRERRGRFIHYGLSPHLTESNVRAPLNVLDFGCCRIILDKS